MGWTLQTHAYGIVLYVYVCVRFKMESQVYRCTRSGGLSGFEVKDLSSDAERLSLAGTDALESNGDTKFS